jgi:hypothetical protein
VHNTSDVRQIEVHTNDPGPGRLEVETLIAKLKKYKSLGSDQIPAGHIQAGDEILLTTINELINFIWQIANKMGFKKINSIWDKE